MKVIFLDFDGVLINRNSLRLASGTRATADPSCVAALNRITDETGAAIVVSSTWRIGFEVIKLRELLASWGVTGKVLDKTPIIHNHRGEITIAQPRYMEINQWIAERSEDMGDLEAWVILDDEADMGHLSADHVRTRFDIGLTMDDAERAIAALNPEVAG